MIEIFCARYVVAQEASTPDIFKLLTTQCAPQETISSGVISSRVPMRFFACVAHSSIRSRMMMMPELRIRTVTKLHFFPEVSPSAPLSFLTLCHFPAARGAPPVGEKSMAVFY